MVRYYVKENKNIRLVEGIDAIENDSKIYDIIWVDLRMPTLIEIKTIEKVFNLRFPTKAESEEIEISSRYWEEESRIEINSYFLVSQEPNPYNETVSFVLQDNFLISIRYKMLQSFDDYTERLFGSHKYFHSGYDIFTKILDLRIDACADAIEVLSSNINKARRHVIAEYSNSDEEILENISLYEDLNMKIRENVTDKQRILTSLLKSSKFPEELKNEITIMLKDVRSLIEYTDFNFERLDYLQSIFLGVLSIDQNKAIKMFTIVNVIFLPPTLIASIYGMNFDFMPETHWEYGYLFAVILMIFSAIAPMLFFKIKGWL